MVNILVISPSNIEVDPRVRRHVETAQEFGSVTTCGYGIGSIQGCKHLEIKQTTRFLSKSLITLSLIQAGFHQFSARRSQFYKEAKLAIQGSGISFDLVIVNDVHALQVARDIFQAKNIWVDMHEYAPKEGDHDWRWRLAYKRHIKNLCNNHLQDVHAVTSVGTAICQKYESDLNREVILLRNTSSFIDSAKLLQRKSKNDNQIHLVHVGVAIRARHLENMVLAARECPEILLHLFILPTEKSYFEQLQTICNPISNVIIEPPLSVNSIIEHISQYDAGVVTIPPTSFNYENGLPNKLFQYIQARLPIIAGPLQEVAEIVTEEDIGIVTKDFKVESIIAAYRSFISLKNNHFEESLEKAAKKYSVENENVTRRLILSSMVSSLDVGNV
jgi:hypothetical protein